MFCTWFSRISTIFAGISFFSCISPDGFAVIFLTLGECPGWFLRKVAIKHGHMLLTCHTLCEKLQAIWQISQVITSFLGPSKSTAFSRKFRLEKGRKCTRQSRKVNSRNPWCLVLMSPYWDVFSDFSKIKRSRSRDLTVTRNTSWGCRVHFWAFLITFRQPCSKQLYKGGSQLKKLALLLSPCTATMHLIACMVHCIVALILCLIR